MPTLVGLLLLVTACGGSVPDTSAGAGSSGGDGTFVPRRGLTDTDVTRSEWDAVLVTLERAELDGPIDREMLLAGWQAAAELGADRAAGTAAPSADRSARGRDAAVIEVTSARVGGTATSAPRGVAAVTVATPDGGGVPASALTGLTATAAAMDAVGGRTFDDGGMIGKLDGEDVVAEADGQRVTRMVAHDVSVSQSGSKVVVEVTITIEHVVSDVATGDEIARRRDSARSRLEADFCPDRDGVASAAGELRIRHDADVEYVVAVRASAQVDDGAYVNGIEVRGDATTTAGGRSNEVVYRRDHVGGSSGASYELPGAVDGFVASNDLGGTSLARDAEAAYLLDGLVQQVLTVAEARWRDGACLEIRTEEVQDINTVGPGSSTPFTAELWHRFDAEPVSERIVATLSGEESIDPSDQPERSPVRLTYRAGSEPDDRGTVTLESTSNRGIARRTVVFARASGWTIDVPPFPPNMATSTGRRCDATEVVGEWVLETTMTDDLVTDHSVMRITAQADGRGTWVEFGVSVVRATDVDIFDKWGGTVTWVLLGDGSVRFSPVQTQPLQITIDGETTSHGIVIPGGILPDQVWLPGGCGE